MDQGQAPSRLRVRAQDADIQACRNFPPKAAAQRGQDPAYSSSPPSMRITSPVT